MSERERLYRFLEERDPMQLDEDGNYYIRHVEAMTAEGLHAKSDIAAELGWRDREIDRAEQEKREFVGMIRVAVNMTDEYFEGRENPEAVRDWAKKARVLLAKHEAGSG